jgi:hypothetical protein
MNDNNIDMVDKYMLDGNQLVDIRWAIGNLIWRLENDMFLYNFAKGGDTDTTIRELKQLLNDIEYNKIRMSNFFDKIEF